MASPRIFALAPIVSLISLQPSAERRGPLHGRPAVDYIKTAHDRRGNATFVQLLGLFVSCSSTGYSTVRSLRRRTGNRGNRSKLRRNVR